MMQLLDTHCRSVDTTSAHSVSHLRIVTLTATDSYIFSFKNNVFGMYFDGSYSAKH